MMTKVLVCMVLAGIVGRGVAAEAPAKKTVAPASVPKLGEQFYVAKSYDMLGNLSYVVLSGAEFDSLSKRIRIETRLMTKAHKEAEKEWNEAYASAWRYPGRGVSARRIFKLGNFRSRERAEEGWAYQDDKRIAQEKRQAEKDKDKQERERKIWEQRGIENEKVKEAEEKEREEEQKAARLRMARNILANALNELVAEQPGMKDSPWNFESIDVGDMGRPPEVKTVKRMREGINNRLTDGSGTLFKPIDSITDGNKGLDDDPNRLGRGKAAGHD